MLGPRVCSLAGPSRRLVSRQVSCTPLTLARSPSPFSPAPSLLSRSLSTFTTPSTFPWPAATRLGINHSIEHRRSYASNRAPPPSRTSRKLSGEQWPWVVVQKPPAGVDEIERVIFARPSKSIGKMFWAMLIVFVAGSITYTSIPSPNKAIEMGIKPEEEKMIIGMPVETFFTWVTGGFIAICAATAVGGLFLMTRMGSRLALVQQKPHGAPASQARSFLRFSTGIQASLPGGLSQPRELPLSAVDVSLLTPQKDRHNNRQLRPYASLTIRDPNASAVTKLWDRVAYRLDFTDSDIAGDAELVLSVPRLDDVFGPLEYK